MQNLTSAALFKRAQTKIAGGVNSPVRSFKGVGGTPIFIKKGRKAFIYSEDGDQYIDYVLSWGALLFGHAFPPVIEAIREASANGTSFGAPTAAETEHTELIQHFYPSCEKIRLTSSGTEAAMSAIRLARGYTGRKKILKFNGCYHGHIDALLVQAGSGGLTFGTPDSGGVLEDIARHTLLCEFNDIDAVKEAFKNHPDDIAGVILEPVPGNMGVIIPENSFLQDLHRICKKAGALLIFDEVMCGFRVSPGGAQALHQIKPDLTCLGKVMGAGLPCAAFGGNAEIMDYLSPTGPVYHAGTLSGNPLATAAGIQMLSALKHQPEMYLHAEQMAKKLADGLNEITKRLGVPSHVNQCGTMLTLFFTAGPVRNLQEAKKSDTGLFSRFFHEMLKRNVYFAPSQFEANFLSSAHQEEDIDRTLEAAHHALRSIVGSQ